jgi:tRNA (guanine37-N1)-methyltransferase
MAPLGVHVALVHHPVHDRAGRVVTTAVTNLDIHDIARAGRTYGVRRYFVVTPIAAQRELVERIISHWKSGASAERIPERGQALAIAQVVTSLAAARTAVAEAEGQTPFVVATAARALGRPTLAFEEARRRIGQGEGAPWLILFGTGWGLADQVLDASDALLPPLSGPSGYNHLSVRSAAAIVLDRLLHAPSPADGAGARQESERQPGRA